MILSRLLNRLAGTFLIIIGVIVISFCLTHLVPADPARVASGLRATEEQVAELREKMGLNKPLYIQFLKFVTQVSKGDLGRSFITHRRVIEDLFQYLPATLELVIVSTIIFVGFGLVLGVLCAVTKKKWLQLTIKIISVAGLGVPAFWLGLMLQLIFYAKLGWLPASGRIASGIAPPSVSGFLILDSLIAMDIKALGSAFAHIILPAFTLAVNRLGVTLRLTQVETQKVLKEDYIRTARAKGLSERVVVYKHAFRNAMIPVVTMAGLQFGWLLGGTVLVEMVFSWPGLGQYAVFSITSFDFMPVIGVSVLMALMFCFINFLVDLSYIIIDPRLELN